MPGNKRLAIEYEAADAAGKWGRRLIFASIVAAILLLLIVIAVLYVIWVLRQPSAFKGMIGGL